MSLDNEKKTSAPKQPSEASGNSDKGEGNRGEGNKGEGKKPRARRPRRRRRRPASDKNSEEKKAEGTSESRDGVEEKQLGPGKKRRIFARRKSSGDGNDTEGKKSDDKGDKDGRRSRRRRDEQGRSAQGGNRSRRRDDNRKPRERDDARKSRGRGNRRSRPEKFKGEKGLADKGSDGVFTDDTNPTINSEMFNRPLRDTTELSVDVAFFEGNEKRDFRDMKDSEIEFLKPHVVDETDYYRHMPVLDTSKIAATSVKGSPKGGGKTSMMDIVGIKTHRSGAIEDFDCENDIFSKGEEVVVETERGMAMGTVVVPTTRKFVKSTQMHKVYRLASSNDVRQAQRNKSKVFEALSACQNKISELRLDMKLVEVIYLHSGNKAVFYFVAEGRVDFRQLVKDLARSLHIRVEMRQIGVRDAAKMIGGIGVCGHQLCCNRYLTDFHSVSIKMAKDQDLVLNPEKVSGQCGRLMCCLAYEAKLYKTCAKGMPKIGKMVETPDGVGRVRDRNILQGTLRVQLEGESAFSNFNVDQVERITNPGGGSQRKPRRRNDESKE